MLQAYVYSGGGHVYEECPGNKQIKLTTLTPTHKT